jgi:hypothetical protein
MLNAIEGCLRPLHMKEGIPALAFRTMNVEVCKCAFDLHRDFSGLPEYIEGHPARPDVLYSIHVHDACRHRRFQLSKRQDKG